jgi:hypothetical protein
MVQLPNPLHQLVRSVRQRELLPGGWLNTDRLKYPWRYLRYLRHLARRPVVRWEGPERLTVILLSFARPENMEPLVRGLLCADFVRKVVLSNNNPAYRMADWLRVRDERLVVLEQPRRTPPGVRFTLAAAEPGEYFITIDDDVFLRPEQLKTLFARLLASPAVPHGVQGQDCLERPPARPPRGTHWQAGWLSGVLGQTREVDVLNRVYAFTRAHLETYLALASRLGLEAAEISNGEDILLSASGAGRPWIHAVGTVADCLSSNMKGIATWATREHFFDERLALYQRVQRLRAGG